MERSVSRGETKVDEERGFPSLLERSPGFARKIDEVALGRAGATGWTEGDAPSERDARAHTDRVQMRSTRPDRTPLTRLT